MNHGAAMAASTADGPEHRRVLIGEPPRTPPVSSVRLLRATQHVLFVVLLLVAVARAVRIDARPLATLAGAAVLALWYAGGLVAERRVREARWAGGLWLGGLVALWFGAAIAGPSLAWLSFALVLLVVSILPPRPAVLAVVGLTLTTIGVVRLGEPDGGNAIAGVVGPVIGALVGVALLRVYRAAAAETAERQRLLDELLAAQVEVDRLMHEAGVRAERDRLAGEIHDTLAQGFSSIVLLARAAASATVAGDAAARSAPLAQIEQVAREHLEEARRLVAALSPAPLDGSSLPDALARLTDRLATETGTEATFRMDGPATRLPTVVETALLRVAQSALANVRQHAEAQRVVVTLAIGSDEVRLDVVDDGCGFDTAATGFGLTSMASRLEALSGSLEVESRPGGGTALSASLPRTPPEGRMQP